MRCFGGVFRHWLRDLEGLGDSGGLSCFVRAQFLSLRDAFLRQADADIPIVRASQALGRVVVGSRLASIYMEAPESARDYECAIGDRIRESDASMTRAAKTYAVV